jgi:hypothetical protein
VAFWWAAGLFAAGAVLAALLFRRGAPTPATPATPTAGSVAEPAMSARS